MTINKNHLIYLLPFGFLIFGMGMVVYFFLLGPEVCSKLEWMRERKIHGVVDSILCYKENSGREKSFVRIVDKGNFYDIHDSNYFFEVEAIKKGDSVTKEASTLIFTFYNKKSVKLIMDFNECGFGN